MAQSGILSGEDRSLSSGGNWYTLFYSLHSSMDGKLFVQFVALIYMSYLKKRMSDEGLFHDYTMQEVLDELDVIEAFENPGNAIRVGEVTKKQEGLYKSLGVTPPNTL